MEATSLGRVVEEPRVDAGGLIHISFLPPFLSN
jgi:hypothetical protein